MVSRPDRAQTTDAGLVATFVDLVLAAALTAAVFGIAVTGASSSVLDPLHVVLGGLLVFVLPGYALTAALFPARSAPRSPADAPPDHPSVSSTERVVLSVGLSLAATPLTVLALNFTEFGIGRASVLNGLVVVVAVALVAATVRRATLPPHQRFRLSLSWLPSGSAGGLRAIPATNVLIAVFLLASAGLVGATLAEPQNGERYTEFYLLTDNGENGTLVADEYPARLDPVEPRSLYVGIANHEERTVEYTVVTELQRIETRDGERTVAAESELDRFTATLAAGEATRQQRELTTDSAVTGEQLRLIFLLYRGAPPETTTEANAYRSTHIWVNATAP